MKNNSDIVSNMIIWQVSCCIVYQSAVTSQSDSESAAGSEPASVPPETGRGPRDLRSPDEPETQNMNSQWKVFIQSCEFNFEHPIKHLWIKNLVQNISNKNVSFFNQALLVSLLGRCITVSHVTHLAEQVFSAHPHVFSHTQRPPQRVQAPLQLHLTLPSSQRLIQTPRALVQRQVRHQPHCMMGRFS